MNEFPEADGIFSILVKDRFGRKTRFAVEYQKWRRKEGAQGTFTTSYAKKNKWADPNSHGLFEGTEGWTEDTWRYEGMLRRVKTDKDDATDVVVCQGVDEWADLSDGSEIGLAGTTTGEEMKPDPLKPEQRSASFNHRRKGDTDINLDLIELSVENPWIKIIGIDRYAWRYLAWLRALSGMIFFLS